MSQNVRPLGKVATIDHAATIAAGLEYVAGEIRAGRFPFRVERCIVVVSGRCQSSGDDIAMTYLGADASTAEVVGMLEMAKLQAANG